MTNDNEGHGNIIGPDADSEPGTGQVPGDEELTEALKATLEGLNSTIRKMEEIVSQIEAGDPDWEENIKLLAQANELAVTSSRQLDRVVQDVVYGAEEDMETEAEEQEG